jgi:hypothetical protein
LKSPRKDLPEAHDNRLIIQGLHFSGKLRLQTLLEAYISPWPFGIKVNINAAELIPSIPLP